MKGFIAIFCLIATAYALECGEGNSHHTTFGTKGPKDVLLLEGHKEEEFKLLRSAEGEFSHQLKPNDGPISFIEIHDNYEDGNGGCASVTSGGVGTKDVTLLFKSKPNRGFSFDFKIWGPRKE